MAHDREVLRMIWEGQIGICFQADSEEIVGIKPEPFYLMVSRLSYLPLVTDKVKAKQNKTREMQTKKKYVRNVCSLYDYFRCESISPATLPPSIRTAPSGSTSMARLCASIIQ